MAVKESAGQAALRWQKLGIVQEHYSEFVPFLEAVMSMLGFQTTDIQRDIGKFIAYGPDYLMVQAQRSQAKTTIAAAYAVWSLIHKPHYRIMIVSAGGSQASDISTLIVRIIMNMPELEMLRPDQSNGDRTSVEAFDVHYTLKGVEKSPSVKCMGITSNMQGNRADILCADDCESQKNSYTQTMRMQLLERTLDFSSIVTEGRIIWLGTPQSRESIYNTLPGRGTTVRIWPGRYPTPEQESVYGGNLAPLLSRRMTSNPELRTGGGLDGKQGQPIEGTDSKFLGEAALQKKEMDQGASWFQLQHMLNTSLNDALRFPLKPENLVLLSLGNKAPMEVVRGMESAKRTKHQVHGFSFSLGYAHSLSQDVSSYQGIVTYVDTAGGGVNGDETAYSTVAFLNGNLFLLDCGGLPGGYDQGTLRVLAQRINRFSPNRVIIEKNMGYGAFREVFLPILRSEGYEGAVEDDLVTGQKEARIIRTLEPILGRGALIVSEHVLEQDAADCDRYLPKDRQSYSLFQQLARVTSDRGSLHKDDRLDSLAGACRYWQQYLAVDQAKAVQALRDKEYAALIADPLMKNRNKPPKRGSLFNRYTR